MTKIKTFFRNRINQASKENSTFTSNITTPLNEVLKNLTEFLLGLSVFLFLVYFKLIKIKPERDLTIPLTITEPLTYFYLFLVLLHAVIVGIHIYQLYKSEKEISNIQAIITGNPLSNIQKTITSIYGYITEKMLYTYQILFQYVPQYGLWITYVSYMFNKLKPYYGFIIFLFFIVPRIGVVIGLIVDIYVNRTFHYFTLSLTLTIIILLFKMFLFALEKDAEVMLTQYKACITFINFDDRESIPVITNITVSEEYFLSYYVLSVFQVQENLVIFKNLWNLYQHYILICYHLLFTLLWLYLLSKIMGFM